MRTGVYLDSDSIELLAKQAKKDFSNKTQVLKTLYASFLREEVAHPKESKLSSGVSFFLVRLDDDSWKDIKTKSNYLNMSSFTRALIKENYGN